MRRPLLSSALVAAALLALPSRGAAEEEAFSFYGLQFGMTQAEAGRHVPLTGTVSRTPGHGMTELELAFDRENLLMEIRAGWARPADPLELQGLIRALREKFITPVNAKYPAIAVTIDEYSNRAAVRLVFLSTNLREKNIEFHKGKALKMIQ